MARSRGAKAPGKAEGAWGARALGGAWPADGAVSSVEEHRDRVLAEVAVADAVALPLLDAVGLVVAEDVTAPLALPRFDNSAMDGYAVRVEDVATASEEQPAVLPVVGEIGAGQADLRVLGAGAAAKIMTGAPVPQGADTVVPYEWTDRDPDRVTITRAPSPGQHLRRAGEDVAAGDVLLTAGAVLGPRHVGLLAAVGVAEVVVRPRPRVLVVSTGSELRDLDQELGHDSIYDGNSYLLAAALEQAGATPVRLGIVPDQPDAFVEALREQLPHVDAVVTSGGVSQGDWDVVKAALAPHGVWFGPVAVQPGRPQGFGLLGERSVPVFTLPGNPVSSYVSLQLFVVPALRKMAGRARHTHPVMEAVLTHAVSSPAGKAQYLRGEVQMGERGPEVAPVGGPGSHLVGGLAAANCLLRVPPEATDLEAGAVVGVLLVDEDF